MEDFMDKVYLEKFQTYCLMKDGTIIESFDDLLRRREELEPYISSFIVAFPKIEKTSTKAILSYAHRNAIMISLKNSIFKRRKSYEETFCSSIFYSQERCAEILQQIETDSRFRWDASITGSNPLVWILGLNDFPIIWSSLIIVPTKPFHPQYEPNEFLKWAFSDKKIDANMYHPFVWNLLERWEYQVLRDFSKDEISMRTFKNYVSKKIKQ